MTMLAGIIIVTLLTFGAWRDLLTRTLPDGAAIAIALTGVALRAPLGWSPLLLSLAVATEAGLSLRPTDGVHSGSGDRCSD